MATKEMQLSDFISHIESDMGSILQILKKPMVFEVMLNSYLTQSGMYEGHIWYEEAGFGMRRLTSESVNQISNYHNPILGEKILIKEFNGEAICWHTLPNDPAKIFSIISVVLRNTIKRQEDNTYRLEQDENYELNVFADNIKNKKFHYETKISDDLQDDPNLLIEEINKLIPDLDILFKLKVIDYDGSMTLNTPTSSLSIRYEKMTEQKARQIMGILASATSQHFHEKEPTLECSIPFYHHRFTGTIPPITSFPTFCIRKHSSRIVTLDQYVASGVMTPECRNTIKHWVRNRFNILIAGGTGSGKTTLANSILREVKRETPQDRVGIIEDTPELQCTVDNHFKFCKTNERDLPSLLRTSLRYRPDRIIVGELRGKEAYVLLKAWMSGHPGGLATIHASSAEEATGRFEQCISENPEAGTVPRDQIAYAIGGIISIQKVTVRVEVDGHVQFIVKRKITGLRQINGYDKKHDIYESVYLYRDDGVFEQEAEKPKTDDYLA